jgi:hypothetical protein
MNSDTPQQLEQLEQHESAGTYEYEYDEED